MDRCAVERYVMPCIFSNMYVIRNGREVLIIDPFVHEELFAELQSGGMEIIKIFLTHEHIDHISGVNRLREIFSQAEVTCTKACGERILLPALNLAKFWDVLFIDKSEQDQMEAMGVLDKSYNCSADQTFAGDTEVEYVGVHLHMVEAPGHSPGSMLIFVDDKAVFTGDSLVEGNGVICRFPGGTKAGYLEKTLPQLNHLPDDMLILPGHGEPGKMGEFRQYLRFFTLEDRKV